MLWSAFFGELHSERQVKKGNAGMQMLCKGLLESAGKPSSTRVRTAYQ